MIRSTRCKIQFPIPWRSSVGYLDIFSDPQCHIQVARKLTFLAKPVDPCITAAMKTSILKSPFVLERRQSRTYHSIIENRNPSPTFLLPSFPMQTFFYNSVTYSKTVYRLWILLPHRRLLSHTAFHPDDGSSSSTRIQDKPMSLRKLAQPFLLTYHPDRLASSTDTVRTTNLAAIQTLNGFIDCIESIYTRAWKRHVQHHGRLDILPMYAVEFIISKTKHSSSRFKSQDTTNLSYYSRRSIEIYFSENERASIQNIDKQGLYSIAAAIQIRNKARREIRKLLNMAGLELPTGADLLDDDSEYRSNHALEDHLLYEELEIDKKSSSSSNPFQSSHPNRFSGQRELTRLELSRREFMKNIDWTKHRRMYNEALEDMKRDLYTQGLMGAHEERKEILIAQILSRVRVDSPTSTAAATNSGDTTNTNTASSSHPTIIDPMEQLIAIRRMSELLMDNFETLEIEEMGRMWETLVFVLLPPWKVQEYPSDRHVKTHAKMGVKKWKKDTGFKFTIHSDNSVCIYVPVDFSDEDFLDEMKANLADFYDYCVSDNGLDEYFPPYYKEWIAEARSRGTMG